MRAAYRGVVQYAQARCQRVHALRHRSAGTLGSPPTRPLPSPLPLASATTTTGRSFSAQCSDAEKQVVAQLGKVVKGTALDGSNIKEQVKKAWSDRDTTARSRLG